MSSLYLSSCDWYDWEEDEWFSLWLACAGGRVAVWLADEEDEVIVAVWGGEERRSIEAF